MHTQMDYSKAKDWIVRESRFNSNTLGKCESIMALGNGYMGLRSSTEEKYLGETRGYYVAGTFNKFNEEEVTELPNAADIINMEITINGDRFTLDAGKIEEYYRELNLRNGQLHRHVVWVSPKGDKLVLDFYRIVSLKDLHVVAQKVIITPLNNDTEIGITSGIDGRMTNSGSQHFSDGDKRFYEKKYMQFIQATTQTNIKFVHSSALQFTVNGEKKEINPHIIMDRRRIYCKYRENLRQNDMLVIEKISNVYTSRDKEYENLDLKEIQEISLNALKEAMQKGYDRLKEESERRWEEKVWNRVPIIVDSEDEYDQLAIRFAQYHMEIMTPDHDNRMCIAAKGLSGEGYKGHTFWDMDIFNLPYFIYSFPEIARKLLEYRYLSLDGARKKARDNGYRGAQFPWESAWLDDGEVTPEWGAADIVTGLPTKIWSGFIEQHITADVAYAVWQYYQVTGDQDFMDRYGYELIFDTATFWASRLEYSDEDNLYHINDVMGPDEYKEHVDDNAFTNYMAYWNIDKAIEFYEVLKIKNKDLYIRLNEKMNLDSRWEEWKSKKPLIYLPQPREKDRVIPQDKEYLNLKNIDLTKYKNQEQVGTLFLDYNLEQVNKIQVSKQADIMMLFFLLEDKFSHDVKRANWNYYEPRTLHDSSLSLSTHCVLACDMGDYDMAYELFKRASRIDLGPNMNSSNDGIHAASLGGIWQSTVYGFGGVRMVNGELRIEPHLPKSWKSLSFPIYWHGQRLQIEVKNDLLKVENQTNKEEVTFINYGIKYTFKENITVKL